MTFGLWSLTGTGLVPFQSRQQLNGQKIRSWRRQPIQKGCCKYRHCRGIRASVPRKSISCSAQGPVPGKRSYARSADSQLLDRGSALCQQLLTGQRRRRRGQNRVQSSIQEEVLLPLGLDFLTFLAATVIVIPVFKSVKASPVLGFLFSGLILGQLGQVMLLRCKPT